MNIIYIHLQSRAAAQSAEHWLALSCPYALTTQNGSFLREGTTNLATLANLGGNDTQVILLLSASDVTLLRMQMPQLSPAKLKAALPNLVEDFLLAEPADCVIIAGGWVEGLRTIAAVQRSLLGLLTRTVTATGIRSYTVLPAQLCLPLPKTQPGITAAIQSQGEECNVTIRLTDQEGLGLIIAPSLPVEDVSENPLSESPLNVLSPESVFQTLRLIAPDTPITLYVPKSELDAYQLALNNRAASDITVNADHWQLWIDGAKGLKLDLLMGVAARSELNLRAWRWPMALTALILLINAVALNFDWWRLKRESNALRATMTLIYRQAYPKETVIIDPLAQMRQKITLGKSSSGSSAPDDFTSLSANLGDAWSSIAPGALPPVSAIEYRDRSLFVHFKSFTGRTEGTGVDALNPQFKSALADRHLIYEPVTTKSAEMVWRIRSAR